MQLEQLYAKEIINEKLRISENRFIMIESRASVIRKSIKMFYNRYLYDIINLRKNIRESFIRPHMDL